MAVQNSTKSQIQMTETILVLFVFMILLFSGVFLYYKYSIKGLEERAMELSEVESTILLNTISSMPELSCDKDCIDALKLFSFKDVLLGNQQYYNVILGNKRIKIEQIYPESFSLEECTIKHYQQTDYPFNCKYWVVYNNSLNKRPYIISSPISIYYPSLDKFGIGKIVIEVFS